MNAVLYKHMNEEMRPIVEAWHIDNGSAQESQPSIN